jgi:glycosyltransferase involved in cell wall biosynthesis
MFSGRAILASSVGGIPEVLEEGHDALLVPPGEVTPLVHGLAKLIEDRSLRARLGEAAASRARAQYSVAAMTDAYETMYRKVTAGD